MLIPLLRRTSEKNRIVISLSISIIILICLGIYANAYTYRYKESMNTVTVKGEVIAKTNQILSDVQEIQNAFRGYVITADANYLVSFNIAERMLKIKMFQVKSYNLSTEQKELLSSISTLIEEELNLAKTIVAVRREESFDAAKKMIEDKNERLLMTNIKYKILGFINAEKQIQTRSLKDEEKNANFYNVIFIVTLSIIVSVVILLLSLLYILKTYKRLISTEKLLLQSQLRLENILDMLPIGIIIVNTLNKEYHANHKALELLDNEISADGYLYENEEENKGQPNYLNATLRKSLLIARALKGEHNIGLNNVVIERNGKELPLRVSATPLYNENNEIEYAISVFDDITNIKNVENELIQAKKLVEQSLRLKESFLTNMSHEIRTPMNAILGFTDLLARKDLGKQENEYVKTIQSSSDNLLRLLNDILDFSKLEADMLVFEEQPMSIPDIISSICDLFSPKAVNKGISLSYLCDPTIPKMVVGDAVRLNQVITNIIGNAIKFTEKGSVIISAKNKRTEEDETYIEFKVKDSGIGIAPDKVKSVFNRFEQADSETTRVYGGTGLGLSIAKHLIESQNGSIEASSQLGLGTVFTFVIPFKHFEAEKNEFIVEKTIPIDYSFIKSINILLVEDNLFNRKLMEGIFREYDLEVDMAENGRDAINMIKTNGYDIILMDIEMPEMNGYETTRVIRNELEFECPIIALTAHAMAGEREKCLQAGMNDYLTKPVNVSLLFEKMYSLIYPNGINDIDIHRNSNGHKKTIKTDTEAEEDTALDLINLEYLKGISNDNKDFEKEMIELLLTQIPEQASELKNAIESNDYIKIKEFSHKLKSLMPIAGVPELSPFFGQLEVQAMDQEISEELENSFENKMESLDRILEVLKNLLESEYA